MTRDAQAVADQLLGSLDSISEVAGEDAEEDEAFMNELNELVTECEECGRWCDPSATDEEGACENCQEHKDEEA